MKWIYDKNSTYTILSHTETGGKLPAHPLTEYI